MFKSISQLCGSKAALAAMILLHLTSSSQAIYPDASGQVNLDLTVRTTQVEYSTTPQAEWSNTDEGQGVRVTLGTFPLDKRLLAGEVVIPQGVLVREISARYLPAVNSQCVVLSAGQGLEDLQQARRLPLIVNQAEELGQGLRIFCAELIEGREDAYVSGSGTGASG